MRCDSDRTLRKPGYEAKVTLSIEQFPQDPAPLYERVERLILGKIQSGEWRASHRLPSEPEFSRMLGISRMTINRAMRELARRKVIDRIPGVGTFVAAAKPASALVEIQNIADHIRSRGEAHSSRVIELASAVPPREVSLGMGRPAKTKLYRALIVHSANNVPVQLEDRYVLPAFAPQFLLQDYETITTTAYLFSIAPPTEADHLIEATRARKEWCRHLGIAAGEPCLVVTRRTWVGDTITNFMKFIHPGSRYSLSGRTRSMPHE
jgi:GntR family transcriptional regulator, histidine utilization repressor